MTIDASKVKVNRTYADREPARDAKMIQVCELCGKPGSWIKIRRTKEGKRAVKISSPLRPLYPGNNKGPVAHEFCLRRKGLLK